MTVTAFQNKLMRMSSKGINVSKLSVAELNKLFGEEMNSQAEATMAMFGAAVAITKNALGVSNQLTKIKGTSNAVGKGSEVTNLLNNMPELTGSNRDKLLSTTQNSELRKIVDQLYRPGATIGDGGTASKLVQEFYEGSSTHLIKAQERLNQLNNLAKSGNLGFNDLDILEALRNDLNNAINLFK
ncbi:MAG: hypothetical protein VB128_09710 [Sedimentibacter saalensis]|jgi:hypothetical protein|uniref:hypothetical protein n=1 Tax=Sedimentibacter saalensis TaxID=130788 RepID=UPI002B21EEC6|nr:hypothetical protein [Sedimentibacter saalensis]MEA5095218.1 hypothetical protein [Sedimentibacter saalensis]